ncbi:hypothetical protein LTR53_001429 [Teratosphaeriaceae sp. CCFEE 6253]|nr:hypothetical protein LTR53_001429 [Teratosphaeriaceae sp. CCFEE 6253]
MTALTISNEDIKSLVGKVVVLTGKYPLPAIGPASADAVKAVRSVDPWKTQGSAVSRRLHSLPCADRRPEQSGIGLATTELLLELGATVVSGDVNPPPVEHSQLSYVKTNVTQWSDLVALFDRAKQRYGRIDHAFANAGISGRADYLADKFDDAGSLLEPNHQTFDVNIKAVVNTAYLGLHHMRHQVPAGGSIVLTASGSSFQRFRVADYTSAKHAVLGLQRGIVPNLEKSGLPLRMNSVAPSWTVTGLVPKGLVEAAGHGTQTPDVVARSVALLMADASRQGQVIESDGVDDIVEKMMEVAQRQPKQGKGTFTSS